MKVAEINMTYASSTGKIMLGIAECAREEANQVKCFSPRHYSRGEKKYEPEIKGHTYFGYRFESMLHLRLAQMTGLQGYFSIFGTLQLIHMLKAYKPDIVHLHNLHNRTINIPILFDYLKKISVPIVWTLHDCWAFTGQCPHFTMAKCEKWKSGCHDCPQINIYPNSFVDMTKTMWKKKRKWFTGLEKMTIVTPSQWLADLVKMSFLNCYPIQVINNGIDLNVFKPTESGFRAEYNITSKYVILGVAFGWGKRKGLDVFIKLASRLSKEYQVVLVGTDTTVEKQLPDNIISIHRTQNIEELVKIYSAADVFVNPTREENYPTVNMEALACGIPVVTFKTGGSPEILDEACGSVVQVDDIDTLEQEIMRICDDKPYSKESCLKHAIGFDMGKKYQEYIKLFAELRT